MKHITVENKKLSREQWKKLEEMQNILNIHTCGENWVKGVTRDGQIIDWGTCMLDECVELINSFSWKHWKKGTDDYHNAKLEIVDILHFVLSVKITNGYNFKTRIKKHTLEVQDKKERVIELTKRLIVGGIEDTGNLIRNFTYLFNTLIDPDELFSIYVGKFVLNKFRQDNGYRDGTYKKVWNGKEDNAVMMEIINKTSDETEIYDKLKEAYHGNK